ncbi:hypothetical protein JW756_04115 [Candidatus Woesearchaeota archaeon]|nr:hypothetical protein [Candidatus Woesearchaeota archaeon]
MQENKTIDATIQFDEIVIREMTARLSGIDKFYLNTTRATLFPGSEYYFTESKHESMRQQGKPAGIFTKAYDYARSGINEALRIAAYPCAGALFYQGLRAGGLF